MEILIYAKLDSAKKMCDDSFNSCGGDVCRTDCPNDYCTGDNGACPDYECLGEGQPID